MYVFSKRTGGRIEASLKLRDEKQNNQRRDN